MHPVGGLSRCWLNVWFILPEKSMSMRLHATQEKAAQNALPVQGQKETGPTQSGAPALPRMQRPHYTPADLLYLQRTAGNQAVAALLGRSGGQRSAQASEPVAPGKPGVAPAPPSAVVAPVERMPQPEPAPLVDTIHRAPDLLVQLKSIFKSTTPKRANADTPLETLHQYFAKYFTAAGQSEQYNFHGLGNVTPSDALYQGTFDKAGKVESTIDTASHAHASGKNRDNSVIQPYGHFGVMERSIFQRQNLGNTYDGGHLVEHTLMEGKEADVHGNLAPQENKNFNQG